MVAKAMELKWNMRGRTLVQVNSINTNVVWICLIMVHDSLSEVVKRLLTLQVNSVARPRPHGKPDYMQCIHGQRVQSTSVREITNMAKALCSFFHGRLESISLLLDFELTLWLALANRTWQKWCCAILNLFLKHVSSILELLIQSCK